jgi:sigma-B regulation protein RsbU (phosphoserine phosphatase)
MDEEGELFKPADLVMKYIDKTHEQRVEERTHELREAKEAVEATQIKLEHAYKELKEVNHIASLDMDIAARIQTSYFPRTVPKSPDWDVSFIFKPVSKVSGDFYDFYSQNGILRGVSLFDVSGHGIGSGLLTLLARSIIAEHITQNDDTRLSAIVEQANQRLINEIAATSNYLTGVILRFTDNKIEYVNAGHNDIFIRRKRDGKVGEVKPAAGLFHGPVLGLKGSQKKYRSLLFSMEADDMLLLYTDCFTEARNAAGEAYGAERIAQSFAALDPQQDAKNLIRHLADDFYSFVDKSHISDDLTVVLVKRKEKV